MKINFLNLKKLFFVFVLALAQHVFSQDTIFKRNGEVIASKVLEINTAEIKFRKTSNLTGPVYSEARNEVLRIKFENGVVDTINESAVIKKEVITNAAILVAYNSLGGPIPVDAMRHVRK